MHASETDALEWDVADRLRKSLRASGVGVQVMADYLGMSRNSISNWINGRAVPDHRTLMLWAMRTGVPLPWLEHGETPEHTPTSAWAPRGSNPKPTGCRPRHLVLVPQLSEVA